MLVKVVRGNRASGMRSFALYAFKDASAAEQVHEGLLREALEALEGRGDYPVRRYYTCTSCGYTFAGIDGPAVCPVCGAPGEKILERL